MTALATFTIRNLEDSTKAQLRLQAASHGRPMEEEARSILCQAVGSSPPQSPREGLGSRIHVHFRRFGGVELALPERGDQPQHGRLRHDLLRPDQPPGCRPTLGSRDGEG